MMRLAWTVLATSLFWVATFTSLHLATFLVPIYCFAVVIPYGLKWCERRFAQYRHDHHGFDRRAHPR